MKSPNTSPSRYTVCENPATEPKMSITFGCRARCGVVFAGCCQAIHPRPGEGVRAPLSVQVTGANMHDKWMADDLIISIVVPRPDPKAVEQHICMDKGCDYPDVHAFVELERYLVHIKHRRRRAEPLLEACPIPGASLGVERTLGWLAKQRSLRVRWRKKAGNMCQPSL